MRWRRRWIIITLLSRILSTTSRRASTMCGRSTSCPSAMRDTCRATPWATIIMDSSLVSTRLARNCCAAARHVSERLGLGGFTPHSTLRLIIKFLHLQLDTLWLGRCLPRAMWMTPFVYCRMQASAPQMPALLTFPFWRKSVERIMNELSE